MGKIKLTAGEKRAFGEITWPICDKKPHPLKDIKGVAVAKDKIPNYMSLFVRAGLFIFDGENYTITEEGERLFKKTSDLASKKTAAGRIIY